jgi:hypothetical protein
MKFPIPFLAWTGRAALEIDIPDDTEERWRIKVAVEIAVKSEADLSGADLSGADLYGADLPGAKLSGAKLSGAKLSEADLSGADLSGANLPGADLPGADLSGADLSGAKLSGADLYGADLSGAKIDERALRPIRADLFDVLLRAQTEVPALLATLRAGKINGSTYEGECACLAGTIANTRHVGYRILPFIDSSRPIERWFTGIAEGNTPENNTVAKITEKWIVEFMELTGMQP